MRQLTGKRVLVVEDEPIVAMCLEDILTDLGCEVVGPAYSLPQGLAQAEDGRIDAAILDVNLGPDTSLALADALAARAVPIVFATGYGHTLGPTAVAAEVLSKPYTAAEINDALVRALQGG
ncbi:Response regulator receiver domain-containing protein [Sphingomonas guangdongensis]|uniref:Response regulator receiver domain-containing protein n=1 Tax=Sphingomonas guangdongensis TaxID=1141890 RepID=A0A285QXX2_9SPHN|nr:response regulator [Sphingomonas guangdongensis]SOB86671.1 Response regulator receiver domain-containing protein [Sphingomonas guangdongensis]